jgi:hypothetical protein
MIGENERNTSRKMSPAFSGVRTELTGAQSAPLKRTFNFSLERTIGFDIRRNPGTNVHNSKFFSAHHLSQEMRN